MITQILDAILLGPLMMIYAWVYDSLPAVLSTGWRLVAFGFILNLALIPAYRQMEARSRCWRALKEQVEQDVSRIKKYFRGRERYFYIRATYRQHRYHPISGLMGSGDLLLQVLAFATVYHFISELDTLGTSAFGPILDLSIPDGLLSGVNLLPLLMTGINIAAVLTYTPSASRRWQGILLAIIFLALLYNSAAGLVLYWTANNIFSLVRSFIQHHLVSRTAPSTWAPLNNVLSQR